MDGTVSIELFADVLCPFSLLAARRLRAAAAELPGLFSFELRTLPLLPDPGRLEAKLGSREQARRLFAERLLEASHLSGGENLVIGERALRDGTLLLPSSLTPLSAVKSARRLHGELAALRLFCELSSLVLEQAADVGALETIAAACVAQRLDAMAIVREVDLGTALPLVAADRARGRLLGLNATPVALLDGAVRLDGLYGLDDYREAIGLRARARARRPASRES